MIPSKEFAPSPAGGTGTGPSNSPTSSSGGGPQEILLAGTGALASLFAACLSRIGVRVTMLGTWTAALQALNSHGVRFVAEDGNERRHPVRAISDPDDCPLTNYAVVLVKAWQTERVARDLQSCLHPRGIALTLQNGYGNREVLAEALGPERVSLGVTTAGATLLGPGRVRAGGEGVVSLEDHPGIPPLAGLLQAAGFAVETTPSADSIVWSKLAINAAINPITALLDIPNGALLEAPDLRSLMAELAAETAAVAAAQSVPLVFEDPAQAAEDVARRTAANFSSMVQDLRRGAPTEIDAICGAVTRKGQQLGVPTPANHLLWRLVRGRAGLGVPRELEGRLA